MRGFLLTAALLTVSVPALAEPAPVADPYGAGSIAAGRYGSIEKKLEAAYRQGDRSVEVLLNLAAIRLQQNDADAAKDLYAQVLAQPNVDMATLNGSALSHDIARRAMPAAFAAK